MSPNCECSMMMGSLQARGLYVQRQRILDSMQRLDPISQSHKVECSSVFSTDVLIHIKSNLKKVDKLCRFNGNRHTKTDQSGNFWHEIGFRMSKTNLEVIIKEERAVRLQQMRDSWPLRLKKRESSQATADECQPMSHVCH